MNLVRAILLSAMCLSHLISVAQAPLWEWAQAVTGTSGSSSRDVQAIDGGCFAPISASSIILQGDTLTGAGFMVFANTLGELRMAVDMKPPRQMRGISNGWISFVSEVNDSTAVDGVTYYSEPGVGLLIGKLDSNGTTADIISMPNLIMDHGDFHLVDIHQGTSGNIYMLGAFADSVAVLDTVLSGSGSFLARFTETGELIRVDAFDIHPYPFIFGGNEFGSVVEGVNGTLYVAVIQANDQSNSELGEGLLMLTLDPNGNITAVYDNGNGTFYPDYSPCLAAHPDGGVYLAYSRYSGFSQGSPITVLRFSEGGEALWENSLAAPNSAFGGAYPNSIETTIQGGVLISGYSDAPLTMPGVEYMGGGPNCTVYTLSEDNEFQWAISENEGYVYGAHASMNSAGEVYATGRFETSARFGVHLLPPSFPEFKAYIARISFGFLGINENVANSLGLYPNPTNDRFRVVLPEPSANWIQVFDQQGRVIHEERTTGQQVDIDVSGIRPGSYVVRSGTSVGQLIVQ